MLSSQQVQRCFNELTDLKGELIALLRVAERSCEPVELDQAMAGRVSRGDALQQQAMAKAGQQRDRKRLSLVIKALKRIEVDEYGICVRCDDDIPFNRLLILPEAELCTHCQEKFE